MDKETTATTHAAMNADGAVMMAHYLCQHCSMSATFVVTPATEAAWLDHVEHHGPGARFDCWVWWVLPLPGMPAATA